MQYTQLNQQPDNSILRIGYPFTDEAKMLDDLERIPNNSDLVDWIYTPRYRILDRVHPNSEALFVLISPHAHQPLQGWDVHRASGALYQLTLKPQAQHQDWLEAHNHLKHQLSITESRPDEIYYRLMQQYHATPDQRTRSISNLLIDHTCEWISALVTILANMPISENTRQSLVKEAKLKEIELIVTFKQLLLETLATDIVEHIGSLDITPERYHWLIEANTYEFQQKLDEQRYLNNVAACYARIAARQSGDPHTNSEHIQQVLSLYQLPLATLIERFKQPVTIMSA